MIRELPVPFTHARWSPSDQWIATYHDGELSVHAVDDAHEAFTIDRGAVRAMHWVGDDALWVCSMDASGRHRVHAELIAVPDGGRLDAWSFDGVEAIERSMASADGETLVLQVQRPGPLSAPSTAWSFEPGSAWIALTPANGSVTRTVEASDLPRRGDLEGERERSLVLTALRPDGNELVVCHHLRMARRTRYEFAESWSFVDLRGGAMRASSFGAEPPLQVVEWLSPEHLVIARGGFASGRLAYAQVVRLSDGHNLFDTRAESHAARVQWGVDSRCRMALDGPRTRLSVTFARDDATAYQLLDIVRGEVGPLRTLAPPLGEHDIAVWFDDLLCVVGPDDSRHAVLSVVDTTRDATAPWVSLPTGVDHPRDVRLERSPSGRHAFVSWFDKRGVAFNARDNRWMAWFSLADAPPPASR